MMGTFAELKSKLVRVPVLKAPLATLLRRLERVDVAALTETDFVTHSVAAGVGI